MEFNQLNIKPELIQIFDELGFEELTPIQRDAIPIALTGDDLIGQAQTGTGKTAAFGIPMLEHLDLSNRTIQGLIIAPTRELAIQVQEELYRYGKLLKTKVYSVYGGTPIGKQIERLKRYNPQIIVGTPGRILDLMNRNVLDFSQLKQLVLDEADEMLNMGFIEDIRAIIRATPDSRQTMLFSATMPSEIKALAEEFLRHPQHVQIEAQQMTADLIDQYFTKCSDGEKFDILTRFIDIHNPKQAIIFCRTKKRVDEVGRGLALRGYNAEMIHGDITQQKRTSVIKELKDGALEILVATDVAARGLDISGVTHVYNYDIPQDPESYVHRIGRTGRAGKEGMSITFVTHNEMAYLKTIEQLTRIQMMPMRPPTSKEAQHGQIQQLIDRMNLTLQSEEADALRNTAKMLLEHYEVNDLVTALLTEVISDSTQIDVVISPQKPLPKRKSKRHNSHSRQRDSKSKHHQQRRKHTSSNRSERIKPENKQYDTKDIRKKKYSKRSKHERKNKEEQSRYSGKRSRNFKETSKRSSTKRNSQVRKNNKGFKIRQRQR